jgi:diaminohydroxyphosphoribosylaminopyrimidine deaminase/5-amino-6-(5-phosphoribosylamino)uracil reductase
LRQRQVNEFHVKPGLKFSSSLLGGGRIAAVRVPIPLGKMQDLFNFVPQDNLDAKRELAFHEVRQIAPDLRILARFI